MAGVTALDASALIAHLDAEDTHRTAVDAAMIERDGDELVISALTLAESLVTQARRGALDAARRAVAALRLRAVPVSEAWSDVAALAALRAQTGLRMPDCCVLQAAESTGAQRLLTFDDRLAMVARERGLIVP